MYVGSSRDRDTERVLYQPQFKMYKKDLSERSLSLSFHSSRSETKEGRKENLKGMGSYIENEIFLFSLVNSLRLAAR